jgi:type II secretory pathway pseudopilin PulG
VKGGGADAGFAMAALLVAMTIMAVFLTMALPAWKTAAQREKETELIFRGQQYARAVMLFQRKYANTFPPNLDVLLNEHFLRKKYKDPMTEDGEFQVLYANQQTTGQPGAGGIVPTQGQPQSRPTTLVGGSSMAQGGIIGVVSKSTGTSIRIFNGHDKYNEWTFVATQVSNRAGAPTGSQTPTGGINLPGGPAGGRGGRGRGGQNPASGNVPPGQGPARGRGQGTFGPRGGAPAPGTPFGNPAFPGSVFVPAPGRGR